MKLLGEKTAAFEPVVSDDVAMFLPETLARFDAIIMNNSNGPWIRPTEADMPKFQGRGDTIHAVEQLLRKSFMDWVKSGRGVVACHHAIGGNTHWPEFLDMIGATYWGHPWNEEVGIKLDDPDHPLMAAFGGKDLNHHIDIARTRGRIRRHAPVHKRNGDARRQRPNRIPQHMRPSWSGWNSAFSWPTGL
jgi:type 1 glutamine amidotransferase